MGSASSSEEASTPAGKDAVANGDGPPKVKEDDGKLDVEAFSNYKDENPIMPNAVEDGYPKVSPPPKKKADIFTEDDMPEPDTHAHSIKPEPNPMLDALVNDLTSPFSSDIIKVRAIFVWIGLQPFSMMRYPLKLNPKSTMGYLKRMALGNLSYAELFTVMCRMAKIPCVMVSGVAKSNVYEIGDEDVDNLRNMWNAVYVKGGWRLVFPLWGLKAIAGRSTGSHPGRDIALKGDALKEMILDAINEYYFLTDPSEFIFRCMPDEENWQLIKSPYTKTKFVSVPLLRPKFFEYGLKLQAGSQEGIILCEEGLCEVRINYSKTYVQLLPVLLYYDRENGGEHTKEDRHTAVIIEGDVVRFVMRLPKGGVYKLQILDIYSAWVCSFKVICVEPSDMGPFPVEAELGFGPYGDLKQTVGLEAKSHLNGMEVIHTNQEVEFVFSRARPMEFMAELVHNEIWEEDLADCVSFKSDMGQLVVKVKIDIKGEFVLMIHAKDVGSKDDFDNVVNYLLILKEPKKKKPGEEEEKETVFSGMDQKVLKSLGLEKVVNKGKGNDAAKNEEDDRKRKENITKMKNMSKPLTKEQKRAQELASLKKALTAAIDSRNIDQLERAIEDSKTYPELQEQVHEAEAKYTALQKMRKHSSQVMDMAQSTISEIHRYKEPTTAIHEVMKATFLLLGENEKSTGDWMHVQNLLRKTGTGSVIGRVKKFDALAVPLKTAKRVLAILEPYDRYEVTDASAGAGTFYIWASNIANDVVAIHT
ncbi:hillarin-like isoform X2 [Pecten maximus]|uniref:hillarin-like isoform X2 n=1 Tax=Pecten maximus TaxID=6579 RepID=UPI001458DDD3|nr:hillarin-like isoform X2 [Pecten maximus]